MISGVDRYYQIARCYRDEDLRSDRQLEFTQLDIEGAFWDQEDVLATIEQAVVATVRELRGVDVELPLTRLTYAESIARFGSDKPDLRFGMEIVELTPLFADTGFRGFGAAIEAGGVVRALNLGALEMSRAGLDGLVDRAKELGGAGLVWAVVQEDRSLRSPVAKFFSEGEVEGLLETLEAAPGDVLAIVADQEKMAVQDSRCHPARSRSALRSRGAALCMDRRLSGIRGDRWWRPGASASSVHCPGVG